MIPGHYEQFLLCKRSSAAKETKMRLNVGKALTLHYSVNNVIMFKHDVGKPILHFFSLKLNQDKILKIHVIAWYKER